MRVLDSRRLTGPGCSLDPAGAELRVEIDARVSRPKAALATAPEPVEADD